MIGRGMVRHEVQHQPQPAAAKPFADSCQRFVPTQRFMHRVPGDREPRAGDVVVSQIRQRLLEFVAPLGIRARDLLRDRPRLPDAQEPDPVEPHPGDAVEFCVGNVIQCGFPAQAARQVGQPDAGVDLVQQGVTRCCHVSALGSRLGGATRCTTQTRRDSSGAGAGDRRHKPARSLPQQSSRFDGSTDLRGNRLDSIGGTTVFRDLRHQRQ